MSRVCNEIKTSLLVHGCELWLQQLHNVGEPSLSCDGDVVSLAVWRTCAHSPLPVELASRPAVGCGFFRRSHWGLGRTHCCPHSRTGTVKATLTVALSGATAAPVPGEVLASKAVSGLRLGSRYSQEPTLEFIVHFNVVYGDGTDTEH